MSFDTSAVEAEIAELDAQQERLRQKEYLPGKGLDVSVSAAIGRIDAKRRELVKRRELILAGDAVDEEPKAKSTAPASSALRRPFRVSKKDRSDPLAPRIGEDRLSTEHAAEFLGLVDAYIEAQGKWGEVEDSFDKMKEGMAPNDSQRAFTMSLYMAIVAEFSTLSANIKALFHFEANRRRELEDRIAGLEKLLTPSANELAKRVDVLEQQQLRFEGVWTEKTYQKNSIVMCNGSAWCSKRVTRSKPDTSVPEGDWQLLVRRGRDGKDKQ
jgi:hypothetical protein